MNRLTGKQIKQIHDALLAGYNADSLRQLVRFHLDEDLNQLAGGANFAAVVFNLIDWAEQRGKVVDLVRAAAANNPHSALQTAWADVQRWFASTPGPVTPPSEVIQVQERLPSGKSQAGFPQTGWISLRTAGWVSGVVAALLVAVFVGNTLLNRLSAPAIPTLASTLVMTPIATTAVAMAAPSPATSTAAMTPTATATFAPSPTPDLDATWTEEAHRLATAVAATLAALPTATPAPTATALPTPTPESLHTLRLDSGVEFTFVRVPAGEFTMGSTDQQIDAAVALCKQYLGDGDDCVRDFYTDEAPQHSVALDEYWIMQTEVTNAQYRAFINADGYTNQEYWRDAGWQWRRDNNIDEPGCWDDSSLNAPDKPVVCVSWYEADAFARWLAATSGQSIRLPSEAEWEKAARGTDGRVFPWGSEWDGSRVNYCDQNCIYNWKDETVDDGFVRTARVGSFPDGASPYGALDMAGNVWEWVADYYGAEYYQNSPERNPPGPASGDLRVVRGGSGYNRPNYVRAAVRGWDDPDNRYVFLGFRVVVSPGF